LGFFIFLKLPDSLQIEAMKAEEVPIVLLQMRNLSLQLGRKATSSAVSLLEDTIWGTPGGMQYQHFGTPEKIKDLVDPWFMYMDKDGETLGVLCLDHRHSGPFQTFYIRYFSFAESMRRKGVSEQVGETPVSRGQGLFKRFSSSFFEAPTQLLEAAGTPKAIFYAYVELENARSRDMVSQMGLTECGKFSTRLFSRMFPKLQANVRRSRPEEQDEIRHRVSETYREHAFYTDHALFHKDNFFVLEREGKVVAGLQAHAIHWKIVDIPGTSGKFMMRILPWMPLLSRLFNPKAFQFAAIEGLFCMPGNEHLIGKLLEGVLAELGLHTAILWMGTGAEMDQKLQANVRWGMLQKFRKDIPATVVMRNYGYDKDEVLEISRRPVYVCAFDST
jgi:hypothetical protein